MIAAMTPADYLESLPADRREAIAAVRDIIVANLPAGYEEVATAGMLLYQVPRAVYPDTYNKQPLMYAALASQKGHMALYLCNAYGMPALRQQLEDGFRAAGKKFDMGKSCLRFKKLADLALPVVGQVIAATPMDGFVAFARSQQTKEAVAARREKRAAG